MKHLRSRATRLVAIAAAIAMPIGVLFSIGAVRAVNVLPGTTGGFEADGNFGVNTAGNRDWSSVSVTKVTDDNLDSGFQGSSKEEEPTNWTCNVGGADPPKGNVQRAYVNLRTTSSPDTAFLNLAFVRESGNGDAHVNFEFNRQGSPPADNNGPCPITRMVGDFLLTYDFAGGNAAAEIRAWTWDGAHWAEHALSASDATAAGNAAGITDPLSGNAAVDARGFGELSLNLMAPGLPVVIGCPATATVVNIRSRSSESITSALQDRLPTTAFRLETCGTVIVHKVDDHSPANPLAGATFGLYANATATGAALKTCVSVADGSCTFNDVNPGPTYSVKEISAPAGYTKDNSIRTFSVANNQTVDVPTPFVDPRDTGFLRIVKQLRDDQGALVVPVNLHVLDGTAFAVYSDLNHNLSMDVGEQAKLWPADSTPAACTIGGGIGQCDVGPLLPGAYRIHETAAPAGTTAGPDVNATVVKGLAAAPTVVVFTNTVPPLNLSLVKSGPPLAHVGDTITYTFTASTNGPRLHGVSLIDLVPTGCTSAISGPTGDDGDGYLEPTESWQWTCTHLVAALPDPLPNTAKVIGIDDFGRTIDATASHTVEILKPAINIVKSGASSAHVGDTVTYTFLVTNTGDTPLTGVAVSDDKLGSVGTIGTLAAGASTTLTKTYVVPAGSAVDNKATACGVDALQLQVCDDDSHHLVVIHPSVDIVKSAASSAHEGDAVTYSFAVTNNGDVPLTNVVVSDNILGTIGTIPSLAVGATATLTKSYTVPPGSAVDNTATACGKDPLQLEVCADDHHHLVVIHPSIQVVKHGQASAHAGDTVFYTFDVTNTGDVALTTVHVVDDKIGDLGTIASLAVGATTNLTFSYVVPAGNAVDNTVTACGKDPLLLQVCDDDHHHLVVLHPSVDVVKSAASSAHEGDTVTYSFKVTNTGDVALTNVVVSDDILGTIGTIPSLAVGADTTLTKNFAIPAGNAVDNTATACGKDPLQQSVCDDDHHHLVVIHPSVDVVKSAASSAHEGDTVTYSFKVTNTGDVALTNVVVSDDILGTIGTIPSLAIGANTTLTKGFDIPAGDAVDNTATACGRDPLQFEVCGDDHHHLVVLHPSIRVVKHGPSSAHEGDSVFYTFDVTNTGDVPLINVEVTDDKLGDLGTIVSLGIGVTTNITKEFEIPVGDAVDNVVTACGIDPLELQVCDDDHHHLVVIHPSVEVVKSAASSAHEGDTVTYSFAVTNTGDVGLTNVEVTDNKLGDIGTIPSLAAGATTTLTKDFEVPEGDAVDNTATACGIDPLELQVCDEDHHHLVVIHPAVTVLKTAAASAHEGDKVTYTFKVTNTGDVPLTAVAVTDDKLGAIGTIDSLAVGASETLAKDFTVPAGTAVDNTATACGIDPLELQVCDEDHHHLVVIHPSVEVVKAGPDSAAPGDIVTYTFKVTNLGDTPLTNVAVTDDKLGDIGTIPSLAVGQTVTLSKQFAVPADTAAVDNVGTACGDDPLGKEVCDTDTHHLPIIAVLGAELARTGMDSQRPLAFAGLLVIAAFVLRRRSRRSAAR